MSEEENIEEAQPEAVQEEQQIEAQAEIKTEPKEDQQQINWKHANDVMRYQKQRIDELEREREMLSQRQEPEEQDEFESEDPDNYISVSKAKKLAEKMAEKKARAIAQQAVDDYAQKQRIESSEERARAKYDDYDYVMTHFAVPMIKNDPALAHKIQSSRNPAETAYKLAKISDEYEDTMAKQVSPKAEKILKNSQRPTSSNAAGSLKSQADKYANMSPADIWAESQKYARRA